MSVKYSPPFALHVKGQHDPRRADPETGEVEPMKWTASCERCGETGGGVCDSGRVRERITKWSILHLHRDPLAPT